MSTQLMDAILPLLPIAAEAAWQPLTSAVCRLYAPPEPTKDVAEDDDWPCGCKK